MDDTASRKHDFDIAAGDIYLNGAANSPLPRQARAAIEEAWALQAVPSRIPGDASFSYADAIRERVGRALRLPADEIGVTTSTNFGMMLMAQGLPWHSGDRLLLGPDEFPSNAYPWFALEPRGVRLEVVGRPGAPLTPDDLGEALDAGGPVRALTIAAVHYPTGDLQPLAALADALHARGAILVVDGAQAAGAVDVDWRGIGVDAMTVTGFKWLLGPYGTSVLWVRPEVREAMRHINGNWLAVEGAHNLDRVMTDYPRNYQRHGRLFDAGEVASYFNLAAFRAGLDVLLDTGVGAAEAHHRALQDRAVDGLAGSPLRAVTTLDADHRSPMLMFAPADGVSLPALHAALSGRGISVSLRAGRLRLSPGIWNDAADVDAFVEAVQQTVPQLTGRG